MSSYFSYVSVVMEAHTLHLSAEPVLLLQQRQTHGLHYSASLTFLNSSRQIRLSTLLFSAPTCLNYWSHHFSHLSSDAVLCDGFPLIKLQNLSRLQGTSCGGKVWNQSYLGWKQQNAKGRFDQCTFCFQNKMDWDSDHVFIFFRVYTGIFKLFLIPFVQDLLNIF